MSSNNSGSGPAVDSSSGAGRRRSRLGRRLAATLVTGLAVAGLSVTNSQGAAAAAAPAAQSVGRFLDGSLGSTPIEQLVDVKDARAVAPGSNGVQNPLDVRLLDAIDLPLTGALQLPELAGIRLGAANQVARANVNGASYGASGAVANSGGVSVGGDNTARPANATIDLSAAGLAAGSPIAVPGGGSAAALGGVQLQVGAVSALAQTPAGVAKPGSTNYQIAGLTLKLGSPALGQLLGTLSKALNPAGVLSRISGLLNGALPPACNLTAVLLPSSLPLEGGAVVISATDGSLAVDMDALLKQLHLNLNQLPANTDLVDYVLGYLTSVDGLTAGIEALIHGLTDNLQAQFAACAKAVPGLPAVLSALNEGRTTLEQAVNALVGGQAGGTGNPLAPIGTALKKLLDIGVNVQPNGAKGSYTSRLRATPNQATPVVAGQTVVRAVEINVLGNAVNVALANAAAGPSAPAAVAPSSPQSSHAVEAQATALPTGVPAGVARPAGSPVLPLVLLVVGLALAGSGAVAWRVRGTRIG